MGHAEYEVSNPHADWAEQDPKDWWDAVCISTRQALKAVSDGPKRVIGISPVNNRGWVCQLNK